MNRKVLFGVVILLLVITGVFYYGQPQANNKANLSTATVQKSDVQRKAALYQNITAKELNDWLASDKGLFLVDVREPDEYKEGYIQGAINIPLGQLGSRLREIPKDKKVIIYCRSGRRSAEGANILVKSGYTQIFNLEGGIINWPYEVVKQHPNGKHPTVPDRRA